MHYYPNRSSSPGGRDSAKGGTIYVMEHFPDDTIGLGYVCTETYLILKCLANWKANLLIIIEFQGY